MMSIQTIEVNDCHTKQLLVPVNREGYENLVADFKFLITCAKSDEDFAKYFPELTKSLNELTESNFINFLECKLVTSVTTYLSIRSNQNESVLGFIKFDSDSYYCRFLGFYIDTNYRNKGIITDLLTPILHQLQNKRRSINAVVNKANIKSRNLLEKLGFKLTNDTPSTVNYSFNLYNPDINAPAIVP